MATLQTAAAIAERYAAPWLIVPNVGDRIDCAAIVTEDGYTVCNPSPMGDDKARLIANAPALLAELSGLVGILLLGSTPTPAELAAALAILDQANPKE